MNNLKIGLMIGSGIAGLASVALILTNIFKSVASTIVSEAERFVGQEEIYNNKGFKNSKFAKKMEAAGWRTGLEWCALFVRMVFQQVAKGEALKFFNKNITAGAAMCYDNIRAAGRNEYAEIISKPERGCLIVYVHHIEICSKVISGNKVEVITGNSQISGQKYGVAKKTRDLSSPFEALKGFVRIKKLK